jgi:O-antigen/teichoic acid export membrane protein
MTTGNLPLPLAGAAPRGKLFRGLARYAVSRGTTEALLAIRGVLLALLLGPVAFGTWALLRLSMRYSALSALSVYRGLELELFQEDVRPGARRVAAGSALGFTLAFSGIVAVLAFSASFLVSDPELQLVLRAFAPASLAEAIHGHALVCIRVRGDLRRYAMLEAGTSVLHLICAVGLGWSWGLSGAFAGLVLANLLGIAAASRWVELNPLLDPESLRRMLRVGLPLVLTLAVGMVLTTGDRWIVALWGGPAMLGYYAFAGSVTAAASVLAVIIRTVVFPQVYGEASSQGAATALRSHLDRVLLPYARILPPVLGVLALMLGPVIAALAPGYTPAIVPARLFLLAGTAIGLVNIASLGALAAGEQRRLPGYAAAALGLSSVLSILALKGGHGLGAVAGASFAGQVVFAGLVLRLNIRQAGLSHPDRLLLGVLLPLIWCTLAVWVSGRLFPGLDPLSTAQGLCVYLLLLLPLLPVWRDQWRQLRSDRGSGIDIPTEEVVI